MAPTGPVIVAGGHTLTSEKTTVIAEIGNNHCGYYWLARHLIVQAKEAGVDAVKLQMRNVDRVFTKKMRDGPHGVREVFGENYGEYRQALELSLEEHAKLKAYAEELGLLYFVTPFDEESVDHLEDLKMPIYKLSSFDTRNIPLLRYVAQKGKPVILSTGMSTEEEVARAVEVLSDGVSGLALLHCVSEYPTTPEHAHLSTIPYLLERYPQCLIGYSGHEKGIDLSLAAVTLGARIVERHFTNDKKLPGPDHGTVSVDFAEMQALVQGARKIEVALGSPKRELYSYEMRARLKHSKSITSRVKIPRGAVLTTEMLVCKSPGGNTETGVEALQPYQLPEVIGRRAKRDVPADTTMFEEDIE